MKDLQSYANFLFEVGVLNRTLRSGFRHLGGGEQTVSQHLLRTAYIGFVLAHMEQDRGEKINIGNVLENSLFHDLGEARSLDLDYISQKYSKTDERKAIEDAVKGMSFGPRILNAFDETENKSTKEGIIAKDADQLELLCSLKEIIDNGNTLAKDWIPPLLKRLRTPSALDLSKAILETNANNWWFENKDDAYWVSGGKNHN